LTKKLKTALKYILQIIGLRMTIQSVKYRGDLELIKLGSEYGGWSVINHPSLFDSWVVSAGAGEDISFDVAMVNFFKAKVVLVDPTPRAVDHYNKVASRFGKAGERPHEVGGRQEPESYELTNCSRENLLLVSQALWNDQTELQFYKPKNREHVSHSINNFQNRYKNDGEHIIVSANTLKNIMEEVNVSEKISLLKLDIEGAEHEVIESMLSDQIRPKQLLVEYDELRTFSTQGRARVQRTHRSLLGNGYQLLHCDDGYNFLYYREN